MRVGASRGRSRSGIRYEPTDEPYARSSSFSWTFDSVASVRLPDDQAGRQPVAAGREVARPRAGHDDRAGGTSPRCSTGSSPSRRSPACCR